MVDCGNARCAQERRHIKRELLTWTKKVPLLLGLEEVSKSLFGRRKMRKILEPFNCLERSRGSAPKDWEPQDVCVFCTSKTKFMTKVMKQIEDDGVDSASSQHLMGMFPGAYEHPSLPPEPEEEFIPIDYNAPLDLSATAKRSASPSKPPSIELKVPSMDGKISRKRDGKKQYTEHELAAAVADIRSGKLGTRRASNLYGIPRSTLRNKIFRMENFNEENSAKEKRLSMKDIVQHDNNNGECIDLSMNGSHDWSHDEWEQRLEQVRHKHDLNAGQERPFGMPPLFFNSNYMIECERAFSLSNPYAYDAKLPFLHDLVRRFAEQRMQLERQVQGINPGYQLDLSLSPPQLEPTANGKSLSPSGSHVDLKIPSYKPLRNVAGDTEETTSPESEQEHPNVSSKISDSLKDIISRSITDRLKSRNPHPSLPYDFLGGLAYSNGLGIGSYLPQGDSTGLAGSLSPAKRPRLEPKSTKTADDNIVQVKVEPGEKPTKKTRPKRGQYRKYNHELLMEAVRAVQRGEMSVHRAGSYYGVPHSTLEYKVKERHLLRQKKPREPRNKKGANDIVPPVSISNGNSNSSDTSSTVIQSESSHNILLKQEEPTSSKLDTPPSVSSFNPLSSYSMAAHLPMGFGWPPFLPGMSGFGLPDPNYSAYSSSGFGINTSASELLKKLQKKVQAKTTLSDDGEESTSTGPEHGLLPESSPEPSLTVN